MPFSRARQAIIDEFEKRYVANILAKHNGNVSRAAAASGLDALTHAVEGYLSVRASPLSDFFALQAMRLLAPNVRAFVANPENLEAASSMALGSMLAGIVVSNSGTGNPSAPRFS